MDGEPTTQRITYGQVINSTLITVNYSDTLSKDLDYAAEVLRRSVSKLRQFERGLNVDQISEKEKMRGILTLNTMFMLQEKFHRSRQLQGEPTKEEAL